MWEGIEAKLVREEAVDKDVDDSDTLVDREPLEQGVVAIKSCQGFINGGSKNIVKGDPRSNKDT